MSHLTHKQRYNFDVIRKEKYFQKDIAKRVGKNKSVVCMKLQRNADKRSGVYKADLAERKCAERHQIKPKKIYFTEAVKQYVNKINEDYSPEQIAGFAKKEHSISAIPDLENYF